MAAGDATKTLRYIFRADSGAARKALKDFDAATNSTTTNMDQATRKLLADFAKIEDAARKASQQNKPGRSIGGIDLSSGLRGVTGGDLKAAASNTAAGVAQGAIQSQFGGAEAALAGVSNKAIIATGAVVGLGAAAAAAGKLSVDAFTGFAEKVDAVQDVMGGTAEQASMLVNFSERFGVSSETLAASQAKLAVNIGKGGDALRQYGVAVATNADGTTNLTATMANVADAYNATEDPVRKAQIAQAAYGKSWLGMVDILERGGEAVRDAGKAAEDGPKVNDAAVKAAKDFRKQWVDVKQDFTEIGVQVGTALVPALTQGLKVTEHMAETIGAVVDTNFTVLSGLLGVLSHLPVVGGKFDEARDAIDQARDSMNRAAPAADDTENNFRGLGDAATTSAEKVQSLSQALSGIQSRWVELHFSQTNAIKTQDDFQSSLDGLDDLSARAADGIDSVGKAAASSAKQVASAQKAIDDANEDLAEAIEDQTRTIEDAGRRMADTEESISKRIVDAQERIIEARERADRQLRDAGQRLEDARQAFQDALSDALSEEDPYKASRRREEAARDLTRAEQDFADTQKDTAKSLQDAQDELADVEVQAIKDRQEAHRQYADTLEGANKRVADAQERVEDSGRRMAETLDDAAGAQENAGRKAGGHAVSLQDVNSWSQTLINNTAGLVASMLARGASWDEIKGKIDAAKGKLAEAEQKFADVGYSAEVYTGILLGIPTEIMTTAVLQLDASQFKRALEEASKGFKDEMSAEYVRLGIVEGAPGTVLNLMPQLNRDAGGPLPPGSSIVHNLTGQTEWVYTAEQMRNLTGGGGTTVNVNVAGSVLAEKDLVSMLARLKRQGYNVGGN